MKTLLASAAILALASGPAARADTTVGAATPNASNCYPFGCNATSSAAGQDIDYQQVYSASAFQGPVTFDTLTFYDSGKNFSQYGSGTPRGNLISGDYTISFFTTSQPLGASYPYSSSGNSQTFFSGHLDGTQPYSNFSISGAAYSYDPNSGNLVMEVTASNQAVSPNDADTSLEAEDTSGSVLSRAYTVTPNGAHSDMDGLVTTFSSGAPAGGGGGGGPEPSTWALMMVGVFGAGAALRRRQTSALALA